MPKLCDRRQPRESRNVYNPAELVPYSRPRTGRIVGQAFLKDIRGDVKYDAGNAVWLHPVTNLTTRWFTKHVVHSVPLVLGNPHTNDYGRQTVADAKGRFEFGDLPPGDYYLTCSITWGRLDRYWRLAYRVNCIYAKVAVRDGETAKPIVTRLGAFVPDQRLWMEQIVFVSRDEDTRMAIEAMKRGAIDYLLESFRRYELLYAVARALARFRRGRESRARLERLTPRELEVFEWLIARLINKEVAEEVCVTLRTLIKQHRARVMHS